MKRDDVIKSLEELDRLLVEAVDNGELTDYAREHCHYCIEDAIAILRENEE